MNCKSFIIMNTKPSKIGGTIYGCIYASRYEGQIVWNACTWFPEIGTIRAAGGGVQRPFGTFPKIHPFWYPDPSLRKVWQRNTSAIYLYFKLGTVYLKLILDCKLSGIHLNIEYCFYAQVGQALYVQLKMSLVALPQPIRRTLTLNLQPTSKEG